MADGANVIIILYTENDRSVRMRKNNFFENWSDK